MMQGNSAEALLSSWTDELIKTTIRSNSLCVAIFSTNGELIFANNSMSALFKAEPFKSFINPTFDNLLLADNSVPLVFEGFLTLGNYSSINTSLWTHVYRKEDKLLVVGSVNAATLQEQNVIMHQLNNEINNFQRELIKEKHSLEKALIQLNEANAKLEKLNIDKDRFISILGHDLKSPFHYILGFSEILTDKIESLNKAQIKDFAGHINKSAKIIHKLLEDILMWARTQQGSIPFKPKNLSISTSCRNIVEILNPRAYAKNVIIYDSSAIHISVYADEDMLKTILLNLVSNAIKFSLSGGKITISAEQHPENVTITVSDNGIGIPPENLKKLFDISHGLTTTGTAKETGTGLGLLLCKEFVEKHGGKIWVESEVRRGSDFKFTLPISPEQANAINN